MLKREYRSQIFIDRKRLVNNLNAVKKNAGAGVKVMAVIKDNAYGHGLLLIAKALVDQVDWFCVADVEEGIALRKAGIEIPILVFEVPREPLIHLYPEYDLTATVTEAEQISRFSKGTQYHLNFDTGMRRLGLNPDEAETVLEISKNYPETILTGIYTHFSDADEPGHPRVHKQLEKFRNVAAKFSSGLFTHLANSGAIFNYKDTDVFWNGVRPGVCLFGYSPGEVPFREIEPVLEWEAYIVQQKKVNKGDAVGYGSRWTAPVDGTIATVSVGYADGLPRPLSGRTEFYIDGKAYPTIGNITMDYTSIFLGNDSYSNGVEVTILSKKNSSVETWANLLGTIPYEITTGLSNKIKRGIKDL